MNPQVRLSTPAMKTYRWGPRVADADILFLGEHGEIHVAEPGLTVPHPEIADRPFEELLLGEAGFTPDKQPGERTS